MTFLRSTPGDFVVYGKACAPDQVEDFAGKKSDLPFVIVPVIEKAIAANAMAGDALDLSASSSGNSSGRPTVMAEIVVPG